MISNKKKVIKKRYAWLIEILVGLIILIVVYLIASGADYANTEKRLNSKAKYIDEQCNSYHRLHLASETKSLMRVMDSSQQLNKYFTYESELNGSNYLDEKVLKEYTEEIHMSGIIIADSNGEVLSEYSESTEYIEKVKNDFQNNAMLDSAEYPQKTYATRITCDDGSHIDLAAHGITNSDNLVITYYHTDAEYVKDYNLSFNHILSGYNSVEDGTIIVTNGNRIIASNYDELVGTNVTDNKLFNRVKNKEQNGKLVHAGNDKAGIAHSFGVMNRGRDYYVYICIPERQVFETTPRNILYSVIVYVFAVFVLNMIRWRTAQVYQKQQMNMQKEYFQSLEDKNNQLKQSIIREEKANAAKTDFLSRMTHDIRTPLNGIIGLLKIDEKHKDDVELINSNREKMLVAANHLLALINDILQMGKLEDGNIELAHEVFNINSLSNDIITIVEQKAVDEGVTLEFDEASDKVKYPYVYGSPLHLRQLFLNVYGNCIKYNKVGGKVKTLFTYMGVHDNIVTYQWSISDTGIGMSEEFLKNIFEPFAQEHTDARSVYQGTGLGMAIVKNLVDKMGGSIDVISKEGKGSTFTIMLHFEIADKDEMAVAEHDESKETIEGLNLLLAEDNVLNAEIASTLLSDEGATVTVVHDGEEVVKAFKDSESGTYDAILMDIMMPKLDGLSATRTIRALEREDAGKLPIIAMTANAFEEDARKCFAAGMDAHLSKPLQMENVIKTIARCCKDNRKEV